MTALAPARPRTGNLVAAIATIACCDIAMGLTFQLLPQLLEARHAPAFLIGLNAAMSPLGIMLAGPFLPSLVRRFGSKPVVASVVGIIVAGLLAFRLFPSLGPWFVIRFVFGMAVGTLFTVSEAWILSFAERGNRGRVMGLYTSVLSVSFAVGPLIIPLTGIEGWMPWLIGAACVALSALPLVFVDVGEDVFAREGRGFFGFVSKAPLLLCAVLACTVFDSVLLSFFAIFGLRSGLDTPTVNWVLGAGIIGNALMQYPIGLLADTWSRRSVIIISALIAAGLSVALIGAVSNWLLWPVFILLGSMAFAVYTVALAIMGDSFEGSDLIAGSSAFAAMWGIGGLLGPPATGALVDAFGIDAVPLSLAAVYLLLVVGLGLAGGRFVRGEAP